MWTLKVHIHYSKSRIRERKISRKSIYFSESMTYISHASNPSCPELNCMSTCPSHLSSISSRNLDIFLPTKSTSYNMWLNCCAFLMSRTLEHVLLQSRSISSLHLVLVLLSAEVSSYSSLVQRGARSGRTTWSACTAAQGSSSSRRYGSSHLRLHEQGYAKVNCISAHHVVLIQ